MSFQAFVSLHADALDAWWRTNCGRFPEWLQSYSWPRGRSLEESRAERNELEGAIRRDIEIDGCVTKRVFDQVMVWGFGKASSNSEEGICSATRLAFDHLSRGFLADAARALCRLKGIGISRASKVIALSNQELYGIYDSRAADGLHDLQEDGRALIRIPPGRAVSGDPGADFCRGFEHFTWVLWYLRDRAQSEPALLAHLQRVADIEIALFSRSRSMRHPARPASPASPIRDDPPALDEGDSYWTLGKGNRSQQFTASVGEDGVRVQAKSTTAFLTHDQIADLLAHFSMKGWFPLGNCVDDLKPGGLGEYFKTNLGLGAKLASHYAAVLVEQGKLDFKHGPYGAVELRATGET